MNKLIDEYIENINKFINAVFDKDEDLLFEINLKLAEICENFNKECPEFKNAVNTEISDETLLKLSGRSRFFAIFGIPLLLEEVKEELNV